VYIQVLFRKLFGGVLAIRIYHGLNINIKQIYDKKLPQEAIPITSDGVADGVNFLCEPLFINDSV
jgi:hypothetical protein